MYLRWQSIPELADLPAEQRKSVWKQAKRDPLRVSDVAWLLIFLAVTLVLGSGWFWVPSKSLWLALTMCVVDAVLLSYAYEALLILRYRPALRRLRNGG